MYGELGCASLNKCAVSKCIMLSTADTKCRISPLVFSIKFYCTLGHPPIVTVSEFQVFVTCYKSEQLSSSAFKAWGFHMPPDEQSQPKGQGKHNSCLLLPALVSWSTKLCGKGSQHQLSYITEKEPELWSCDLDS